MIRSKLFHVFQVQKNGSDRQKLKTAVVALVLLIFFANCFFLSGWSVALMCH